MSATTQQSWLAIVRVHACVRVVRRDGPRRAGHGLLLVRSAAIGAHLGTLWFKFAMLQVRPLSRLRYSVQHSTSHRSHIAVCVECSHWRASPLASQLSHGRHCHCHCCNELV